MPNNPIIPTSLPSGVVESNAEKVSRPVNVDTPPAQTTPPAQPVRPVQEVRTVPNAFTENITRDALPNNPEAIAQAATDSTGKKLSHDEQVEFIKNLPDELLAVFARRVQQHMEEAQPVIKKRKLEYVTNFDTLQEDSVFDLNTPIEAIDHQLPEFLDIKLLDPNFSPRWIQTSSKNLGQKRSQGWQYISREDLAEDLKIEIEADAQGHLVYIDTVAMKIPKKKLYTQLRSNYLRAISMTQQAKLHETMKQAISSEIERSVDDKTGLPLGDAWHKYNSEGKMTTYSPLG